jgi:peptidoglycan/xylan/chitin deacetylase (PgdA/CDA1 family)
VKAADWLRAARAARHGIVYAAPRRIGRRELALTFDDGPSEWTPPILDLLQAHAARATFFVLGASADGRGDIVRRAAAEGHELGNHTYSHADPEQLPDDELRSELERTGSLLESLVGKRPVHFRPPYAATNYRVADVARGAGLERTVLRSIDPADWSETDGSAIAAHVLERARPGAIVCLHDGNLPPERPSRQPTVDALARIVPELTARGYRLVTVSELLAWNRT